MESLDTLILGVEAAIGFAGFAGIIATFQFGEGKNVGRGDAVALTMIVQFSLLAAFVSSVAILLHTFGTKETAIWTITSTVVVISFAIGQYTQHNNLGNAVHNKTMKIFVVFIQCVGIAMILINTLNALNIFFHREAGPVIAGIVWALTLTGIMFSRLLLRPIWRGVRELEATKLADAT